MDFLFDNPETFFIPFFIGIVVLAIVGSFISEAQYRRRRTLLESLEQEQPRTEALGLSHPLLALRAELERENRLRSQPSYPIKLTNLVLIFVAASFIIAFFLSSADFEQFADQFIGTMERLQDEVRYFLLIRELPREVHEFAVGIVPPILLSLVFIIGPTLLYIVFWLSWRAWVLLAWRSGEGYIYVVDTHSEIRISGSGKNRSRQHYHVTRLVVLYRDAAGQAQIAHDRAEGWRGAYRLATRYRVGQQVALRIARRPDWVKVGRVLDDAQIPTSSPLIERM